MVRKKTSGRKKGTPNKVSGLLKEWHCELIESNKEQIKADFAVLSPRDRVMMIERFLSYILPKQKADEECDKEDQKHQVTFKWIKD